MQVLDALGKVYQQTGLWVPQPLGMVQRRCCCGGCETETCAQGSNRCVGGTAAGCYDVTFPDGWTPAGGNACTEAECDELIGTFRTVYIGDFDFPSQCQWGYDLAGVACLDTGTIKVQIGNDRVLEVIVDSICGLGQMIHTWTVTLPDAGAGSADCLFGATAVPHASTLYDNCCTWDGQDVTVAAA